MDERNRIGIVGAGQIGAAIASTLARTGRWRVTASRNDLERVRHLERDGVRLTADNRVLAQDSDVVFLAVKPYKVDGVLRSVADVLDDRLLVSVAAATSIAQIRESTPRARVVRAMPNVALMVGASFTAWTHDGTLTAADEELVEGLLGDLGESRRVDEPLMNAVTALSGSGPAYVATLIEAMAYAGLKVGLPRDFAYASSAQTVLGTARLCNVTGLHTSEIKEMVLTPAGTTIEGIFYLEESGVRTAVMKAVEAATRRAEVIEERLRAERRAARDDER
jgi:pyrroline-5-carboxylate reductase